MRLWKRASGAFKDKTSLWQANLTRRTLLRNPEIDKAVIRATSHQDSSIDRRNIERVCEWLRLSPLNLSPILWSITARMEKTHDWAVALKGLLLTHAVMSSKAPCVRKIGRLPFDLSGFKDGHDSQSKAWPFDAFIRAYYAYLDQKSAIMFQIADQNHEDFVMSNELVLLQKLQKLADLLIEIKPAAVAAFVPLTLDVMDGIIIEIYDVYGRICRGIALVLINVYYADKAEAATTLRVVKKATEQGEDLTRFFEFCRSIGVVNVAEFPAIDRIPDEGIRELEEIIEGFRDSDEDKVIVVKEVNKDYEFRTIITDDWERFEEDTAAKNVAGAPFTTVHVPDLISLA